MSGPQLGRVGEVELVAEPDHDLPLVRFVLALRHSALSDPAGQAGRLSLALELMLRGTQRRDRQAFNLALEQMGAQVDCHVSHEGAWVRGACLAHVAAPVFELVGEALCEAAMAADTFDSLRDEAAELAELGWDDDDHLADLFLRRQLYDGHPLGRPAAGDVDSLRQMPLAAVRAALGEVGHQQLLLAFAGDITAEAAAQLAAPVVARLPSRPLPPPPPPPPPGGEPLTIVVVDKPGRTQVQLRVGQLALDAYHPDVDLLWWAVMAFGGTFTSPMTQAIRDERGWSYTAGADVRRRSRHRPALTCRSAPAIGDAVACLRLTLDLLDQLATGQLPSREGLEATRAYMLGRAPFEVASAPSRLGLVVAQRLLGLPADEVYQLAARWEQLEAERVPQVLRRHLGEAPRVAVLVAPADQLLGPLATAFPGARLRVVDYRQPLAEGQRSAARRRR